MVVVGVLLILQNLGYSIGSLLAGLGIGGLAMALAANGRFEDAVALQRQAIETSPEQGMADDDEELTLNLQRYLNRQPSPRAWEPGHPVFSPPVP